MGKKKVFTRVLSFLIAVNLVHVPIGCANDLPEWMQDAEMNVSFWPILTDLLQKKEDGGGVKAL